MYFAYEEIDILLILFISNMEIFNSSGEFWIGVYN